MGRGGGGQADVLVIQTILPIYACRWPAAPIYACRWPAAPIYACRWPAAPIYACRWPAAPADTDDQEQRHTRTLHPSQHVHESASESASESARIRVRSRASTSAIQTASIVPPGQCVRACERVRTLAGALVRLARARIRVPTKGVYVCVCVCARAHLGEAGEGEEPLQNLLGRGPLPGLQRRQVHCQRQRDRQQPPLPQLPPPPPPSLSPSPAPHIDAGRSAYPGAGLPRAARVLVCSLG
jgi:hypothetical protein